MKPMLAGVLWALTALTAAGEGTVQFLNDTNCVRAPIYGPEPGNPAAAKIGNTTAGVPPGTQVYTGAPLSGSNYRAQLFAAPGCGQPETELQPGSPITTFQTGGAAGYVSGVTAVFSGVPADAVTATIQLRVWDDSSGLYPTWIDAEPAWLSGLVPAGKSALFCVNDLGGGMVPPPLLCGLQSFNIYYNCLPISIQSQPTNQAVVAGQAVTFCVSADGGCAPTYQWLFNDAFIAGATASSYTISSVQLSQQGSYRVVVTNVVNGVTSEAAVLTVLQPDLVVTTIADSGPGSLRQAMLGANAWGGGDITFSGVGGTVTLLSPLPDIATNIDILGPGTNALAISGNNAWRIFRIKAGATCLLSGLTIKDGDPPCDSYRPLLGCDGGGILNEGGCLTIINCCIRNNTVWNTYGGESGGGIASSGSLTLSNVSVLDNHALWDAGGIMASGTLNVMNSAIADNLASEFAGGIAFDGGSFSISNSLIAGNVGDDGGGLLLWRGDGVVYGTTISDNDSWFWGPGGGIRNGGTLTLVNCTVSGNSGVSGLTGPDGSGIVNSSVLSAINCTIVSNHMRRIESSPGAGVGNRGTFSARNTIIAGSTSRASYGNTNVVAAPDFSGVLDSQGHNLIGTLTNATITGNTNGNLYGVDPLLGPLQDNGGPTWTHALLPGSPAIDSGSSAGLTVDQRGFPRPYDVFGVPNVADGCDIGAFESLAPPAISSPAFSAHAWGLNTDHQTEVPGGTDLVAISAGFYHNLAVTTNGAVLAWGQNGSGEATVPASLTNAVGVAAGWGWSMALKPDGTVLNWGWNACGSLNAARSLSNIVAIAAGWDHGLALHQDGTVAAFGMNNSGQTTVPSGATDVVAIAGGGHHSLALKRDGTVIAWGDNTCGQTNVPPGLTNVAAIAGGGWHSLALKWDGSVVAWGVIDHSQTNLAATLSNVVAISGGWFHSLALLGDGTPVAWGANDSGQCDLPTGLSNVVAVAGGGGHSLVLAGNGAPVITVQPLSQTALPGTNVCFRALAVGVPPLSFRWCKNAEPLFDGLALSGADSAVLQFGAVSPVDEATYDLAVGNRIGAALSAPASLHIRTMSFVAVRLMASGRMEFTLAGTPGDVYGLQVSTDLVAWVPTTTITNVTGTVQLTNCPTGLDRCFYRFHLLTGP